MYSYSLLLFTPYFLSGPLSFEYLAWQKCILSFGGDCRTNYFRPLSHWIDKLDKERL